MNIINECDLIILIKILKQSGKYKCQSVMGPMYDFHKMMHIMIDINDTEYELFPSDENLDNYLKILFSKKSASDIKKILINSMDLTVFCPYSETKKFYSEELNYFLDNLILRTTVDDLNQKVNILIDACIFMGIVIE